MPQISRRKSGPTTPISPTNGTSNGGGVTDKFFEWVIESTLPSMDFSTIDRRMGYIKRKARQPLSINTTTKNFTRMTCRTGLVFDLAYEIEMVMTWQNPSLTLSALSIYSYICAYPSLLIVMPLILLLYGVMVPAYMVRHPANRLTFQNNNAPTKGPPTRPAEIVTSPVPEVSREFYLNVVDTQNSMADFVEVYDKVHSTLKPVAFWADESKSSLTFLALLFGSAALWISMPLVTKIIPAKLMFIVLGWFFTAKQHPRFGELVVVRIIREYFIKYHLTGDDLIVKLQASRLNDFVEYEPLEQQVFESFEVQTYNVHTSCWTESLFYTSPYENPEETGHPSINEFVAPPNWTFTSKWARDYDCEKWSQQRFVTELEVDESKWVYDYETSRRVRRWIRWGTLTIKT